MGTRAQCARFQCARRLQRIRCQPCGRRESQHSFWLQTYLQDKFTACATDAPAGVQTHVQRLAQPTIAPRRAVCSQIRTMHSRCCTRMATILCFNVVRDDSLCHSQVGKRHPTQTGRRSTLARIKKACVRKASRGDVASSAYRAGKPSEKACQCSVAAVALMPKAGHSRGAARREPSQRDIGVALLLTVSQRAPLQICISMHFSPPYFERL